MNTAKEIAADIARELREHPERWCQFQMRNGKGARCLLGHIMKRASNRKVDEAWAAISSHVTPSITGWNDQLHRSVSDVIALCEKVANS